VARLVGTHQTSVLKASKGTKPQVYYIKPDRSSTEQVYAAPKSAAAKTDADAFYRHNNGSKYYAGVL
jgi:hypothetical protein